MKKLSTQLLLALVAVSWLNIHAGAVSNLIRFQGRLTDKQGRPISGVIKGTFEIYDAASGGTSLWGPASFPSGTASNEAGLFTIEVGPFDDISIFSNHQDVYMQVVIKGGTGQVDQALTPRQRLANVPMAFYSQFASSATVAGSVPDNSISTDKIQNNAVDSSKILDHSVQGVDIASRTILSSHIADETITPQKLDMDAFNSAGLIIPAGAVFMFLSNTCPSGYTPVEELNGRFPMGADSLNIDPDIPNSVSQTLGVKKHSHNIEHTHLIDPLDITGDRDYRTADPVPGANRQFYSVPGLTNELAVAGSASVGVGIVRPKRTMSAPQLLNGQVPQGGTRSEEVIALPPALTVLFCRKD